jgi:hypothetical protein
VVEICCQEDANGVPLKFRKTVSAKQSKIAFLSDKMVLLQNGVS